MDVNLSCKFENNTACDYVRFYTKAVKRYTACTENLQVHNVNMNIMLNCIDLHDLFSLFSLIIG